MNKKAFSSLVVSVAICVILFFSLTLAQTPPTTSCQDNEGSLTQAEREQCIEIAGGIGAFNATADAVIWQTMEAAPTPNRTALLATSAAEYETAGRPTVAPTMTPGIHPELRAIRQLSFEETVGGTSALSYKYNASVWLAGAVVNQQGYGQPFFVTTHHEKCALNTFVFSPDASLQHYNRRWSCPEDIGEIIITDITAQDGIVTLTDRLNRTITFDLSTEIWTLDDSRWDMVPSPTHTTAERQAALTRIAPVVDGRDHTEEDAPISLRYEFMRSVWRVGGVTTDTGEVQPFYVSTPEAFCSAITVIELSEPMANGRQYMDELRECPQDIGPLTITAATGPTGTINFTDEISRTIILDLGTEKWTLEGEPWLPAATPTP